MHPTANTTSVMDISMDIEMLLYDINIHIWTVMVVHFLGINSYIMHIR